MKARKHTVLGIDPGFATIGWAIVDYENNRSSARDYGVIETSPTTPFAERLLIVHDELIQLIDAHKPDRAGVEQLFFAKNTTTAIHVAHARGVIVLALSENKLPIYEYTPLQIKQATASYGRAGKKQMQKMMQVILNLPALPTPDDAADALAIAWLCAEDNKQM